MLQICYDDRRRLRGWQVMSATLRAKSKTSVNNPSRKLSSARASSITDQIFTILQSGEPTYFAFEGSCVHGVRSQLCLEGWGWADANRVAEEIVRTALNRLGLTRPTWKEGQPEWTQDGYAPVERTRCLECGGAISAERRAWRWGEIKYCSESCGNIHRCRRHNEFGSAMTRAEFLASQAAERENRKVSCPACKIMFLPTQKARKGMNTYCSNECFQTVNRKLKDKPCLGCGVMFRPRNAKVKFCSKACHYNNARTLRPKPCAVCGIEFRPANEEASSCSLSCKSKLHWIKWRETRQRAASGEADGPPPSFVCEAAE